MAVKLNGVTAKTNPSSGRPGVAAGLPRHDLSGVGCIETHKVDQLARGVNLRLVAGLSLAKHRRRIQRVAVFARQQVRSFQENRRTILPGHGCPVGLGGERRLDGPVDNLRRGQMGDRKHVVMVSRIGDFDGVSGVDRFTTNDAWNFNHFAELPGYFCFQRKPLWAARGVGFDPLVDGFRWSEDAIGCCHARLHV